MSASSGRQNVIIFIFLSVGLVYLMRLFFLQVLDNSYKNSADNNVIRIITDYPSRGLIYDRKGRLFVYNEPVYDLMIIPKQARNLDTLELCGLIGITKEDYIAKFQKARAYSPVKPSLFEKQLSVETYATLQEKLYKFPGSSWSRAPCASIPNRSRRICSDISVKSTPPRPVRTLITKRVIISGKAVWSCRTKKPFAGSADPTV